MPVVHDIYVPVLLYINSIAGIPQIPQYVYLIYCCLLCIPGYTAMLCNITGLRSLCPELLRVQSNKQPRALESTISDGICLSARSASASHRATTQTFQPLAPRSPTIIACFYCNKHTNNNLSIPV